MMRERTVFGLFCKNSMNFAQADLCVSYVTQRETGFCYSHGEFKSVQRRMIMTKITKDMKIGELLRISTDFIPTLMSIGMHCLGCPSSQMETIEQACLVHGVDPDALVEKLNQQLEA